MAIGKKSLVDTIGVGKQRATRDESQRRSLCNRANEQDGV